MSHAGWYPDPRDPAFQRWWDGSTWLEQVRPVPPGPPPLPNRMVSAPAASPLDASTLESVRKIDELRVEYERLQQQVIETREAVMLQEVGLYHYSHPLDSAPAYEEALASLEGAIKTCIKEGKAVSNTKKWVINGSEKEGAKMVADFSKLILRAYNTEVDNLVRTLKPYSLDSAIQRLEKLRASVAKLGASMKLAITDEYHALRIRELQLTADFLAKTAEEKERQREERLRLKEEEAVQRELARERAKLEKELTHYETVAAACLANGDAAAAQKAQAHVAELKQAVDGVIEREANTRAGYVYVISNIGSFGETMVKIGLTRRSEPMDRVRELGDASVPFRFDVHALFFSKDAVGLETELHKRFAAKRVNLVNSHREFFYVSPHAVKEALLELRGDLLTFTDVPEALEWHQSENTRRGIRT